MYKKILATVIIVGFVTAGGLLAVKLAPDMFPITIGSTAPGFDASDLHSGDEVALADYDGEVVLLNIWATWCAPCVKEMPALQRLHTELADEGLHIVAVSVDDGSLKKVKNFVEEFGLTFTILHDTPRTLERTYQTTGLPESFVIDRHGVIIKKIIGAHDWDSPSNVLLLRRLLSEEL